MSRFYLNVDDPSNSKWQQQWLLRGRGWLHSWVKSLLFRVWILVSRFGSSEIPVPPAPGNLMSLTSDLLGHLRAFAFTYVNTTKQIFGVGEMPQWLRALAVLAEYISSGPHTYSGWLTTTCTSTSKGYSALFWHPRALYSHKHIHKCR